MPFAMRSFLLKTVTPAKRAVVFCRSGQRAYYATRILLQNGFKARNIAGGMLSRSHLANSLKFP